jgi:uncharacterized protein with HEPN domain
MRHRLIHGYAEVRIGLVWSVVQNELPRLIDVLKRIIPKDAQPADEA